MANKVDKETLYDNLSLELRRGVLVMVVLSQLREEQYGYSLKQALDDRGLAINEGTLYPLLRRLESQGLLDSDWRVVDDKRPRRYYRISATGAAMLDHLIAEWQDIVAVVASLLKTGGDIPYG